MSDTLVAGRYRLGQRLGSGGMGRVWLARDEVLHRNVAVKELLLPAAPGDDATRELRMRTLREARAAARLSHPNVVRVYDVTYANDRPWIVMEYVESRSLARVVKDDGPLDPVHVARVGVALLDALSAAHAAGVLHRDIKPGNVLLADDGRVMLTDFGLATYDEPGTDATEAGIVYGSPQFIAPERALDGTSTVEADLWSLGATLYAAVEGRSPYARPTASETLLALASGPPDPPRRAGPLTPVLAGLLRRNPLSRMPPHEVHGRLRGIVAGEPAGNVPPPPALPPAPAAAGRVTARMPAAGPALAAGPAAGPALAARASRASSIIPLPRRPLTAQAAGIAAAAEPPTGRVEPPAGVLPAPARAERPARRAVRWAAAAAATVLVVGAGTAVYVTTRGGGWGTAHRPALSPAGVAGPPTTGPQTAGAQTAGPQTAVPQSASAQWPCPTAAPADAVPVPIAPPAPARIGLAGQLSWYEDPDGMLVPVPTGWRMVRGADTSCFYDAAGGRTLAVVSMPTPAGASPVGVLAAQESALSGRLPDYRRVGDIAQESTFLAQADWEYTAGATHSVVRDYVGARRTFLVQWSTRADRWTANLPTSVLVRTAFTPPPGS